MTTNNVCCFLFSGFCGLLAVLGCPPIALRSLTPLKALTMGGKKTEASNFVYF